MRCSNTFINVKRFIKSRDQNNKLNIFLVNYIQLGNKLNQNLIEILFN